MEEAPVNETALHLHASAECAACHGVGRLECLPCSCALRSIHDQLLEDYSEIPISADLNEAQQKEAYRADLEGAARRSLTAEEHWIWRLHHVHRIGIRGLITFFKDYGVDDIEVRDLLYRAKAKVALTALDSGLFTLRID